MQASKFSARGLNSAPVRSIFVILEISINQLRKDFPYGGGGVGVKISCKLTWKHFFSLFDYHKCNCFRGLSPLVPRPPNPDRAFQPLQTLSIWRPDNPNLAKVKVNLHTEYQGRRSNGSAVRGETDGRTDRRTLPSTLASRAIIMHFLNRQLFLLPMITPYFREIT